MIVDNGVLNGGYCDMNSSTGSDISNHYSIDYTKKRDKHFTKKYIRGNINYGIL